MSTSASTASDPISVTPADLFRDCLIHQLKEWYFEDAVYAPIPAKTDLEQEFEVYLTRPFTPSSIFSHVSLFLKREGERLDEWAKDTVTFSVSTKNVHSDQLKVLIAMGGGTDNDTTAVRTEVMKTMTSVGLDRTYSKLRDDAAVVESVFVDVPSGGPVTAREVSLLASSLLEAYIRSAEDQPRRWLYDLRITRVALSAETDRWTMKYTVDKRWSIE